MQARRSFLKLFALSTALAAAPMSGALAQVAPGRPPRLVLKGFDPVAYFTDGRPVPGSATYQFDWDGERYHFASAANRDRFKADPERYAPQFGGYCTGSMGRNVRNEADPKAWIISDGKLYVFGAMKFSEMARKDPKYLPSRIPLAQANWRTSQK